jgi:uncharacterized protein
MIVFGLSGVLGGGSCDSSTGAPRSVASSKTSAPAPASARCLVAEPREASAASRPSEADGCPADPVFGGRELSRGTVRFPDAPGAPSLDVELAVTPRDRQRGLMYRTRLGENRGMLFDFGLPERRQSFWMRNTCISLDMLFVNEDGHIAGIIEIGRAHV